MPKKHFQVIIGFVVIVLSMFYAFRGVSFAELGIALKSVKYFYLIPAILLVALSYVLRAIRWHYLVRSVKEVKTINLISPLMVGCMANMLPARAGEFIRAYLLSNREGIRFSSSFATIFIEKLFDLFLVLLLLVWVLFFMPEAFLAGDSEGVYQMADKFKLFGIFSFILCLFIFLFSAFMQFKKNWAMKVVGFLARPLPHIWKEKVFGLVGSFIDGLKVIRDKQGFFATGILSFLIWATSIFTYYPLYMAFGIEDSLPVVSSLVILCLTVAVFITVAPTPGFIGSYHLGCVAALHGIFGIQKALALSYGIVAWFLVMGFTVVVGAIFAIKENISIAIFSSTREQIE